MIGSVSSRHQGEIFRFAEPDLLSILKCRLLRLAMLLFQAIWLNAIVPGHQRGLVGVPGERCAAGHTNPGDCCAEMAASSGRRPASPASGDPASHCAICHFAAALLAPPPINLAPPPLEFLEILRLPSPAQIEVHSFPMPYDGRAPPTHSFHLV
jgi:hypothetical protein